MVRGDLTYRRGAAVDAAALASFGSQSFVDAYGSTTSPREVAVHVARTYSTELQLTELNDSRSWTILGEGFRESGRVPFMLGMEEQRDLVMSRVLPAA